jgi:aspartate aminotransferase-like enzyme
VVRRLNHPALVLVDSVSGLGALPLEFDAWDLDFVLTGTQKALRLPPGLLLCAVSERAWAARETARLPRFYFDLGPYAKGWPEAQTPYTPALSLWFGLQEALRLLRAETLEGSWVRHRLLGEMARAGVKALGLPLLAADERYASNSVTAFLPPEGLTAGALRKTARETYGVQLAGGQAHMKDSLVRIGHLGYIHPQDVLSALAALELTLAQHGKLAAPGAAVAAAQAVWLAHVQAAAANATASGAPVSSTNAVGAAAANGAATHKPTH